MAKTPNYTDEQTARMRVVYEAAESDEARKGAVKALAVELGKKERSIVSKLSNMEIYQAPERTTKDGKELVTKETLNNRICAFLGINPETSGFAKANKEPLRKLADILAAFNEDSDEGSDEETGEPETV